MNTASSSLLQSLSTSTPTLLTASTTIDRSTWKTYTSSAEVNTYSVSYPRDFILTKNAQNFSATIPRGTYVHWPLEDDVKINASTTCSGGVMDTGKSITAILENNGYLIQKTTKQDVAAGNRYEEIVYKVIRPQFGSRCLELSFLIHGANGAGLIVDNVTLVKKYNDIHDGETRALRIIFDNMVDSLKL
jgi:hypothetical protein